MTNHIRTTLLNLPSAAAGLASGLPGAEYIEGSFTPNPSSVFLYFVEPFLYTGKSAAGRILQVNALMPILHSPGLEYWALLPDSRITYDPSGLDTDKTATRDIARRLLSASGLRAAADVRRQVAEIDTDLADLMGGDIIMRTGAYFLSCAALQMRETLANA